MISLVHRYGNTVRLEGYG